MWFIENFKIFENHGHIPKSNFWLSYISKLVLGWFDNGLLNFICYQSGCWLKLETLDTLMWVSLCLKCGARWKINELKKLERLMSLMFTTYARGGFW